MAAFLLAEVATFGVAIAGKWLVAGRLKAGRFPLWGTTYFRWWLADRLCELPPLDLLTGTPLLVWYLRALGASIGRDVLIDSLDLRAPDLLTIEPGASVGTAVHIENARVEGRRADARAGRLGRDAVVDSYAVLENDTALGAGARPGWAVRAGRRAAVPEGEIWEGSPARRVERTRVEPLPPRPPVAPFARWCQSAFLRRGQSGGRRAVLHDRLPVLHADRLDGRQPLEPVREQGAPAALVRVLLPAGHSGQHGARAGDGPAGGRVAQAVLPRQSRAVGGL